MTKPSSDEQTPQITDASLGEKHTVFDEAPESMSAPEAEPAPAAEAAPVTAAEAEPDASPEPATPANPKAAPLSIRRNMLWNAAGSYINLFAQWAITVFIVRLTAGYEAAGVYGLAMAIWNTFAPLAHYKMNTYQISDVEGENSFHEYVAFRVLTSSAALVIIGIYSAITAPGDSFAIIMLYALWKITSNISDVFRVAMQRKRRMDYMGISFMLEGLSSLTTFVIIFGTTQNVALALICMCIVTATIGIAYVAPHTAYFEKLGFGISAKKVRYLLLSCAPIAIASVAAAGAPSIPRQYLGAVMGDAALGAYSTMAAPVAVIQAGAAYIYNPVLTYLSAAYAQKDKKEFNSLIIKTVGGIVAFTVAAAIALELVGRPLLRLVYGPSILEYFYLLQPLMACAAITGITWFLNDLCVSLRDFPANFLGSGFNFVVSLGLMVPCVAAFALNGVTIVNIIGCVTASVFMYVRIRIDAKKHFARDEKNTR